MPTRTDTTESNADEESPQQDDSTTVSGFKSVDDFTKHAFRTVVTATRAANAFPQGASRDLYCAYPTYGKIIDHQSQRVMGLISKVLKAHNVKGNLQGCLLDEQFEKVQECNDIIFERLGTNLDIKAGLRLKQRHSQVVVETEISSPSDKSENPTTNAGSWNKTTTPTRSSMSARLIAAKNIERPQAKFKVPVDNSPLVPFVPKLKEKPNSLKPLAILPEYDDDGNVISYLHPYEFELLKFEPAPSQLNRKTPIKPKSLEETTLLYVDTVSKLQQALEELRLANEIAIDVEHHSYRTFMGITCLVQMSTREKDYIFDSIALREDMHVLNEVLTNPKIIKILHGADLDVEWLQRDLSIYIVNMFDTHKAARALNLARVSLAFLLKNYVNIDADKSFQLADWRMRPLPEELVAYARQDTHYLIYIYELVTNELLDIDNGKPNTLRAVYQQSTDVCKKRYVKPHIGEDSHLNLLRKSNRVFDNRQLTAFRDIFRWRDETARLDDESYGYVLPNHMMLQIAESLPREMQGILACCNPIPPPVRQQLHKLHEIILRARDQPLVKPILDSQHVSRATLLESKVYSKKLYCPHDLSHMEELRDDLPTLLDLSNPNSNNIKQDASRPPLLVTVPAMSLFKKPPNSEFDELYRDFQRAELRFKRMPYKRYMAILPFVEKEKREEALRQHNEMKKRQLCPAALMNVVKGEQNDVNENSNTEPDIYSLPLKEQLKRKYQVTPSKETHESPKYGKRIKSNAPQEKTPTDDKLKFNNLPDVKGKNKTNQNATNEMADNQPSSSSKRNTSAQDNSQTAAVNVTEIMDDSDEGPNEQPVGKQEPITNRPKANQKRNNNKKFKAKARLHVQSSNRPVSMPANNGNFDYGQVDFRKFKGGAQRARGNEVKSQFQGRNQPHKARNKQFNKLFTFSNVKGNKK